MKPTAPPNDRVARPTEGVARASAIQRGRTARAPIPVPRDGLTDLVVVSFLSVLLLTLSVTNQRRITRWEGALLLVGYLAYVSWRVVPQFLR